MSSDRSTLPPTRTRKPPKSSSRSTPSSVSRRRKSQRERWSTDEDEQGVEEELSVSEEEEAPRAKPARTRRKVSTSSSSSFFSLSRTLRRLLVYYLSPFLPYALTFLALYLSIALMRSYLHRLISSLPLPSFLLSPLSAVLSLPLPSLSALTPSTSTLLVLPCWLGLSHSASCPPSARLQRFQLTTAETARVATVRASNAVDIFQHLAQLADPDEPGLSLYPVEIWTLSAAVRHTTRLENREVLASELARLGDLTREVKDQVMGVNAMGQNSMVWILHEFTRLEDLLSSSSSSSPRPFSAREEAAFATRVDALFSHISTSLGDLLLTLDRALPVASLASDSARQISSQLTLSGAETEEAWERLDVGNKLLGLVGGAKARHLLKDLRLAERSSRAVEGVWKGLEETRGRLWEYSLHVGQFKAGVTGFHLAGHGLSAAEEISSLKNVMGQMREVVESQRARGSRGSGGGAGGGGKVRELGAA